MSVDPPNTALTSVFSGLSLANLDYVKSATASSVYYTGTGWFGDLVSVPSSEMLKFKKATAQTMTMTGKVINPSLTYIPVTTGWNRIGYLLKGNSLLNSAFDKSTLPTGSLLLKSKDASALYYPASGWVGDLDSMRVLNGYMLKTETAGSIRYNASGVKPKSLMASPALFLRDDLYGIYNIHPADFEYSANLIGEFINDAGENETQKGDLLIAYMDGVPRGVTESVLISDLGRYVFFITIFSNSTGDITFQLKSTQSFNNNPLSEKFVFAADAVYGEPFKPVGLHMIATGIRLDTKTSVSIYPNPVTDHLDISSGSEISRISVYNSIGTSILVVTDTPGTKKHLNTHSLAPGLYILKIETKNGTEIKKFIKSSE